jgi:hypothetical protein
MTAAADELSHLSDVIAQSLVDYGNDALSANEGEPLSIPWAIIRAGRDIRAGLERLAVAIEGRASSGASVERAAEPVALFP